MNGAKLSRWSRIVNPQSGYGLIVPIDHGFTSGPISGIGQSAEPAKWLTHPGITAVVAHKGMIDRLRETRCLLGKGVILQLNGMMGGTSQPNRKEMLTSIETSLRMGVDAVSLDLVFDGEQDLHNLKLSGKVTDQASAYGLPVLVMVKCLDAPTNAPGTIHRLRHVVRSLWELGCDGVKLQRPSSMDDIPVLLEGLTDDIHVFFAGGARGDDQEIAGLLTVALDAGAKGLCVGRNVFQNPHPEQFLTSLALRFDRKFREQTRVASSSSPLFSEVFQKNG
jgi:class I fructose-bisphosphate aldolase/fructose-bisphosphate aldolase/2-amino-3,7-dideoxy-D-threo-hept-6-ulosonate synthase